MLTKSFKAFKPTSLRNFAAPMSSRTFFNFGGSSEEEGISDAPAKRVAVTGAAGNIAYSVLFRLAAGEFLGKRQRIILHLIDLPFAEKAL